MDAATNDIRHIEVAPGVRLAVKVSGTEGKPALVFSNSLAADLSTWDEVAERLAPHAHIVRYDTRGHGRSDTPAGPYSLAQLGQDALAVMDALGVQRAVLCGLSLGGLTGMWLGAHASERIAGLVLANTAASFPPAQMWLDRAASAREGGLGQFIEPTLQRWFTQSFRDAQPERVAEVGCVIGATAPAGYAASCELLAATDLLPDLGTITCPVRVIVGAHDPSTPPARGAEIVDAIAGADLVTLDAAHLSAVEAKDAFADALIAFLSRVKFA
ncbi:3-oxoadipate enol-lactonase [Aquabacter sp. CN5-332]|uniref:3-oxoadipate enol-lactonase n=1 Tax=Aquabacter sp. CN5-332 TaxID=3156608 RepID=UPI0032B33F20